MSKIGIKTTGRFFNAAIARAVRKYRRNSSIAEVKRIVSEGSYLYECDYIDAGGIATLLSLHDELKTSGIETVIYEHDQITTVEFLKHLLASYAEAAAQAEAEMDLEASEEI